MKKDLMEDQFEQFQRGLTSALESGSKMTGPVLHTNEVMMESFNQLIKEQLEFSRTCMEIGRKQMESVTTDHDFAAMFGDHGTANDYYAAVQKYGEAVRKNAEHTRERMAEVGREMTADVADLAQKATPAQAPLVSDEATRQAPPKAAAKTTATASKKAPAEAAKRPAAKEAPQDKASAKTGKKATAKASAKADTSKAPATTTADAAEKPAAKAPDKATGKASDKPSGKA